MHVLMVAAENGALPGGKVGGIGDVIRDAPRALARAGHRVTVITPGYGILPALPGAERLGNVEVEFAGDIEQIALYRAAPARSAGEVEYLLIDHPLFSACGAGRIYCNDDHAPYETDAHKFALLCAGVCRLLLNGEIENVDVVHLHDWHTAPFLFLRRYRYTRLQSIRAVYSIHNLSIQGVRPFAGERCSLENWYGVTAYVRGEISDTDSPDCVNMMRMGVNLADRIHVVSPTYAGEILRPSDPAHGFIGGEGLEVDLRRAARRGILAGILNGCEYPGPPVSVPSKKSFIDRADQSLLDWAGDDIYIRTAWFFATRRLNEWEGDDNRDDFIVASISRITAQKVSLLAQEISPGVSALDAMLEELQDGTYIMLGSGDEGYERFLTRVMIRHENFIFLRGYSEPLSEALYPFCHLFLMPSSFEPCGISQMLAMRAGRPCLVHNVGGLADTVRNRVDGFTFTGDTPRAQAGAMLEVFREARQMKSREPDQWRALEEAAARARFSWDKSVAEYVVKLYS